MPSGIMPVEPSGNTVYGYATYVLFISSFININYKYRNRYLFFQSSQHAVECKILFIKKENLSFFYMFFLITIPFVNQRRCEDAEAFEVQDGGKSTGIFTKYLNAHILQTEKVTHVLERVSEGKCFKLENMMMMINSTYISLRMNQFWQIGGKAI